MSKHSRTKPKKALFFAVDFCTVFHMPKSKANSIKNRHTAPQSITDYISDLLKKEGLRMTTQRRGLIQLLEKSKVSLSIKEIFKTLTDQNFKIDEASVYRIIEALKDLNLVHINSNGKIKLCSHVACEQSFHLSIECEKCQKVLEPHLDSLSEQKIAKTLKLKLNSIKHLHIEYLCEKCEANQK